MAWCTFTISNCKIKKRFFNFLICFNFQKTKKQITIYEEKTFKSLLTPFLKAKCFYYKILILRIISIHHEGSTASWECPHIIGQYYLQDILSIDIVSSRCTSDDINSNVWLDVVCRKNNLDIYLGLTGN